MYHGLKRHYANWDSIKDFINTLRRSRLLTLQVQVSSFSFLSAFLRFFEIWWLNFNLQLVLTPRSFWSLLSQILQEPIFAHKLSYLCLILANYTYPDLHSCSYIQTIQLLKLKPYSVRKIKLSKSESQTWKICVFCIVTNIIVFS